MKKLICILLLVALALPLFPVFTGAAGEEIVRNNYRYDLWLKVGTERYCAKGTAAAASAKAFSENGEYYLPVDALEAYLEARKTETSTGFALNGVTFTYDQKTGDVVSPIRRDGVAFLALSDAAAKFSLLSYADETMGLFALSDHKLDYDDTYNSMQARVTVASHFVFDEPSDAKVISDVEKTVGLTTHPRLLADQDKFDELRALYENASPETAYVAQKAWLTAYVGNADKFLRDNFTVKGDTVTWKTGRKDAFRAPYFCYDENGKVILPKKDGSNVHLRYSIPEEYNDGTTRSYTFDGITATYTYTDPDTGKVVHTSSAKYGDGYDEGGRLNESAKYTLYLQYLGFAWQMTGAQKYANAFYALATELAKWPGWGEGHFLNVADAGVRYALGFDWIYHAFDNDTAKRDELAKILYDRVVVMGYWSSYRFSEHNAKEAFKHMYISSSRKGNWNFDTRTNNWNSVCTSGIVLSALALLEYRSMRDTCAGTISALIETLPNCFAVYAPDGCYMEGPGYWGYGTGTLLVLCAALQSACGDEYGIMDLCGLDKTGYYIYYVGNGKTNAWAMHDGGGVVSMTSFYYLSRYFGNSDYAYLRDNMLKSGVQKFDYMDIFYFDPSLSDGGVTPDLDYNMKGLYTATMRSSWDQNATFTGLHAGPNFVSHGDMDSGNFILQMNGVNWFYDLGAENYNIGGYFQNDTRYWFYRKLPEAHSTVFIRSQNNADKSDEYARGQVLNSLTDDFAEIIRFDTNEYGAVAVADMTPQYGSVCKSASRALMLTASRKAVVVQDDLSFNTPTSFTWNAIFGRNDFKVELENRDKTAYITYNKLTLRATLLSSNALLRFSVVEAGTNPVLPNTVSKNSPANQKDGGGQLYPYASETQKHLSIVGDNITECTIAVVFELISDRSDPVCYERVATAEMTPENIEKYRKPDPSDVDWDNDGSAYQPRELQAAIRELTDFSERSDSEFAAGLIRLYVMRAGLNPENPDTADAVLALRAFLRKGEVADRIDAVNEKIIQIENARAGKLCLPVPKKTL